VEIRIKGSDLRHGRPKDVLLTPADLAEALSRPIGEMSEFIRRALEDLPPDVAHDVMRRAILLTGGGALLDKLDVALQRNVGAKFVVPPTPMHCVIRGSAAILESLDTREHLLIGP
jgi:rod shape-determining protein MreB